MPRSRTFKIIHMFYLLVIAVLGTLLFVERQSQPTTPSNSDISEQISTLQEEFDGRFNDLYSHIDSQLEATREQLARHQDETAVSRTAPPASTQNPPVDSITANQETPVESAPVPLTASDYARLGSAMVDDFEARQAQFEIQSVDPDWAYPSTNRVRELFNQDDYLRQLHLTDIECRSNLCQIDIDVADPQSINPARLLQALNQVNDNDYGFSYRLQSQPQEHSYRVLLQRIETDEENEDAD